MMILNSTLCFLKQSNDAGIIPPKRPRSNSGPSNAFDDTVELSEYLVSLFESFLPLVFSLLKLFFKVLDVTFLVFLRVLKTW